MKPTKRIPPVRDDRRSSIDRRAILSGAAAAALSTALPWRADAQPAGQTPASAAVFAPAAGPGEPPVTGALSRYIASSPSASLPDEIRELGKRHILDTLASIVACRDLQPAVVGRRYAAAASGGGATTILATRERASLADAVFASAVTGHAAEINDFSPSSYTQPGPSVLSTALLLGASRGRSGSALLNAVVTGYELTGRVPKALGIKNLRDGIGLASHSVGPTFGAAAAAASILRMSEDRIPHLLSYCAQQASGSWQWLLDVDHIEKAFVFAGMPARNGLQAALMVEAGFTGVPDALDRQGGWMMSGMFTHAGSDINRRYLIDDLGRRFELPLVGYKRYPTGGPAQSSVEAMLQLARRVDRRQIDRVHIAMPERADAFANAAMPALNLPYLCAIIILDGRLDFAAAHSVTRKDTDPAVRAIMARVEVVHDPAQEREPRAESARVTVTLRDGTRQEQFIEEVVGFPTHPMSHNDVEAKALELLEPRLGADASRRLVRAIWGLETVTDINELVTAIAT
jgi:2-methylcitrate dehydratase PrpD